MLKILYSVFIGLLVSVFIGFGIATFYPAPEEPEYPEISFQESADGPSREETETQKEYDDKYESYQEKLEPYNRNVALIAVTLAVVILVVSLKLATNMPVITEGLLLGGVFTLLYGIGRSLASGDNRIVFTVVSIGLAVAVAVGYMKFVKPANPKPPKNSAK